LMKWEK